MIVNYNQNLQSIKNSSKAFKSHDKVEEESVFITKDQNNTSKDGDDQYFDKRAEDFVKYFSLIHEITNQQADDNFYKHINAYNEGIQETDNETERTDIIA
ncbi:MAG: hypothetical protein ACK4OM_03835 [Alphaproteobacteria bacterium]